MRLDTSWGLGRLTSESTIGGSGLSWYEAGSGYLERADGGVVGGEGGGSLGPLGLPLEGRDNRGFRPRDGRSEWAGEDQQVEAEYYCVIEAKRHLLETPETEDWRGTA